MFDDMKRRYRLSRDKDRIEQLQRIGERLSKVVFWDMPDADWEFVVFEVPEVELEWARQAIPRLMAGVAELKVPLLAEVGVGPNWDQAH